jgi:hypothetical protein
MTSRVVAIAHTSATATFTSPVPRDVPDAVEWHILSAASIGDIHHYE